MGTVGQVMGTAGQVMGAVGQCSHEVTAGALNVLPVYQGNAWPEKEQPSLPEAATTLVATSKQVKVGLHLTRLAVATGVTAVSGSNGCSEGQA